MKYNIYENFSSDTSGNNTDTSKNYTSEDNTQVVTFVSQIFNNSGLFLLASFLVIYLVVFVLFGMYLRRSDRGSVDSSISRTFDFAVFGVLFVYAIFKYVRLDSESKQNPLKASSKTLVEFYDDELSLFSTMLFMVCFYLLMFFLRIPTREPKPTCVSFIELIGWILLATLVIHNCLKFFFNVDLLDELRDPKWKKYLDPVPDTDTDSSGNTVEEKPDPKPEVFNISNNLYTYDDAQAICLAHDSRLATYDEIEKAYNIGAEWCNYGWSAGQMAFFPTQKKTWEELQNSEKHKNSCVRPGVNGGYFANPYIKFGVNCYGIKPEPKAGDLSMMETRKTRPYPRTEEEQKMDEKVEYWKNNMEDMLRVSSHNRDKWSRY